MTNKLFLSVLIASTFSLAACAQDTWLGTYQYVAELGENVAEDKVIVEYIFRLTSQECKITAQGYQMDEAILCSAEPTGKILNVRFKSYEDGSTQNIYGVAVYNPGEVLFTLSLDNQNVVTTWKELTPDESCSSGIYFEKVK
jgi:hypothetical protein